MKGYDEIFATIFTSILAGISIVFKGKIKSILTKKSKKEFKSLLCHDMFITAKNVKGRVEKIDFITKGKTDVVKTKLLHILIDLKIESVEKGFTRLLESKDIQNIKGQELKFKVSETLIGIVKEYNDQALFEFIKLGISKKDASFLIDKYEEHRQYIVDGFIERLDSISINKDYNCNFEKLSAILEVVALSLYVIPRDVKHAMNSVNGRYVKYEDKINI